MGIETLQKAALAAGFVMATPDDEPLRDVTYADAAEEAWQPPTGQWLVPLAHAQPRRASARDAMATAAAWVRDHLPTMMGGRAPA
jgi:hypothetical protein